MTDTKLELTVEQQEARDADRDMRIRTAERELAALMKRLEVVISYEEVKSTQSGTFNRFMFYDNRVYPPTPDPVTAGPQLVKRDAAQ